MNMNILGMGTALPPHSISQRDAATFVQARHGRTDRQRKFIEEIYLHAGVERRYSAVLLHNDGPLDARQAFFSVPVDADDQGPTTAQRMQVYSEAAPALAVAAAQQALAQANLPPEQITHLVIASCTGFAAPGFDLQMVAPLQLDASVLRTHVGFMGCHAALNALRVAQAFTSDPAARVLVVCVELCSLHHQYGCSAEQVVANGLFADGAAAVVCAGSKTHSAWSLVQSASVVIADTSGDMSWKIGDHGFQMTLSKRLPEIIATRLRPWLSESLAQQGHTIEAIGSWAIHPGGPKIISACEDALGIPAAACAPSREILAAYGNMSSATVLFVIDQLRRNQAALPCVALAFGPGLTIEAALFE